MDGKTELLEGMAPEDVEFILRGSGESYTEVEELLEEANVPYDAEHEATVYNSKDVQANVKVQKIWIEFEGYDQIEAAVEMLNGTVEKNINLR